MTNITMWKCYRCELTFQQEAHAKFHKNLSNHNSQKVMISCAWFFDLFGTIIAQHYFNSNNINWLFVGMITRNGHFGYFVYFEKLF